MIKIHPTIIVHINYESVEGDYGKPVEFLLTKTFSFNLPKVSVKWIVLKNDALSEIPGKIYSYDPEKDEYIIYHTINNKVGRYYHGDALTLMTPLVEKFKNHGWEVTRIK